MNKHLKLLSLIPIACSMSLVGCSCSGNNDNEFDFTIALESGKSVLQIGEKDKIVINTNGVEPAETPNYVYDVTDINVASVSETGEVEALALGTVTFTVTDTVSNVKAKLPAIEIINPYTPASGGYNFAAASGAEAIAKRTEILGSLEKYAMDSHLTGITLFENGGYVKYHKRVEMPTTEYIVGYGFGILSEGNIKDSPVIVEDNPAHKLYYHSSMSEDPLSINALNNDGSQVSDLHSYIASSYWSTKMKDNKSSYEWFPQLAKDVVGDQPFNRPIPIYETENPLGLYKKWRIYVKTGEEDGLKYTTLSTHHSSFNGRNVALEDYEFIYEALYTGSTSMTRGSQMASDSSYGVKGALKFYNRTKTTTDYATSHAMWNAMKASGELGIKTDKDSNGSYIELELLNPIDSFTAMYTLSSTLVSPLPKEFIVDTIGEGSLVEGMKRYGVPNNTGYDNIVDYTLCLGAYTLEQWVKQTQVVFKRNDDWFEIAKYGRYRIKGVKLRVNENARQNPDAIYNEFYANKLDSCGIPTLHIDEEVGNDDVFPTKGDSTFKLNVNSCSPEYWDSLFGPNGSQTAKGYQGNWKVKPWMSNEDFLKGLFYSINRGEFAKKRGVQPSINYFSDSYLSDPENGVSYNSTDAHKNAVRAYEVYDGEGNNMYGYNYSKAVDCFKRSVNTLLNNGSMTKGQDITITIVWMNTSDPTEYGEDIAKYFEDAFNHESVSGGTIKLHVENKVASDSDWQQVYEEMRKGNFDLGFGAISGNTYNPLNFLEVLKSDNSSGFTLNWGTDTSKVDDRHPLIYNDLSWSFDALWAAADHGSVVDGGKAVNSVKSVYIDTPAYALDGEGKPTSTATANFSHGAYLNIPVEFVNVPDVEFTIDSLQIYVVNYGNFTIPSENITIVDLGDGKFNCQVLLTKAFAEEINEQIRITNHLRPEDDPPVVIDDAFKLSEYRKYWTIEMYFNLSIAKGTPSQSYITIGKNADDPIYE